MKAHSTLACASVVSGQSSTRWSLKPALLSAALALGAASSAQAYEFNYLQLLGSQENFALLAKDLSSTLAFKPMAPSEGLGLLGFDIGLTATTTQLKNVEILERAAGTSMVPANLPTLGARVSKGLPLGFDVGLAYNIIPGSFVRSSSADLKWTFISGGPLSPALAVRGFYTEVNGISRMGLRSRGVDVSVSKGFAVFTPYVGVGLVNSTATTTGNIWSKETYYQMRTFAGANLNLVLVNLAGEIDKTGDDVTYSVKVGLRF
jgi:hypothetical protein